jgi:hypothetical protein
VTSLPRRQILIRVRVKVEDPHIREQGCKMENMEIRKAIAMEINPLMTEINKEKEGRQLSIHSREELLRW